MARETRAQRMRMLREENERNQRNEEIRAGYNLRLITALERASTRRWEIRFVNTDFGHYVTVNVPEGEQHEIPSLGPSADDTCTSVSDHVLTLLEWQLNDADQRDRSIREQAVAKLSAEEKRVLGIR